MLGIMLRLCKQYPISCFYFCRRLCYPHFTDEKQKLRKEVKNFPKSAGNKRLPENLSSNLFQKPILRLHFAYLLLF